ncbi:MAG: pirin family protein [Burkholderiales bacterium]|nr:pirin family protein [Burkholderiales bacterium]
MSPSGILIRKSAQRGHSSHGWLDSFHTFSFSQYHDPKQMGHGSLRVINDDRVAPGTGFATHPHRDMEIISYVIEGELAHRDSMGNESVIRRGDVQRMSAGSGILHSEYNPSGSEPVHFLQIWILPDALGIPPEYQQKHFTEDEKSGRFRLIASRDGREGSLSIHQDTDLYATIPGEEPITQALRGKAYLHVVKGEIFLGNIPLSAGDGARIDDEPSISLSGCGEALLFDMRI